MSGAILAALRIGFLALLWLFIALTARVIKTDLFGRTNAEQLVGAEPATGPGPNPKRRGRAPKQARIIVLDGPGKGDAVPLAGDIVIGRAADSTLDVADDFASSHHAHLYQDAESWIVADLGSTNGTVVNGLRISRPTRIGDGDVLKIGRTSIKVEQP